MVTVKQLFAELPHSDSATRHHFDQLLAEGWISLKGHDSDRRLRYVKVSTELEDRFIAWGNSIKSILSNAS